jgi:type II secretion system protein H
MESLIRSRDPGFTLLEVLVVVAVVALTAALVIPNLFPDERQIVDREAARLRDAMEHAALAAQWQGENLAWSADANGYRFWRYDPTAASTGAREGWRLLEDDEVLVPHAAPGLRFDLYGQSAPAREAWTVLRADGANEPYSIAVSGLSSQAVIQADPLNRVRLAQRP